MDPAQRAVAEEFDRYQENYKSAVDDALAFSSLNADFFTKVKEAYLVDLIEDGLGPVDQQTVLDVGCGVGVYHGMLAPKLKALHGCDVSEACLKRAEESNPSVNYKSYDGATLPYEDGSFDLAFAICVVHHVPQESWPHFFSEMARVVRAGGLVAIFEHNPRNPLTMRVVNNCPFDADAVLLNSKETSRLITESGLDIWRRKHILSIPAAGSALRSVDQMLSWIGLGAQYYVAGRRTGS
ncbi:class I SAM-dependent methyltransferase [Henriciella marina]|uniref:class I SAM-dependent methyltransferase n=1 Tax=Henriciella marina TaxID=453851 RepID=UPI000376A574|nr:class I SAM-dependent methyltransferase [Henriciella marina]